MHLPRSLPALVSFFPLFTLTKGLVSYPRLKEDIEELGRFDTIQHEHRNRLLQAFKKRQNAQDLDCPNDRWQEMLDRNPPDRVMTFCNEWLGIGPATKVVEWTPTITVTSSASSTTTTTSTTRLITTQTTTQTVTTTIVPDRRRAAHFAAVAEDIINSVIASGANEVQPTSKNSQRLMAESGLGNACSCKMVDPTATVTSLFTVPPVYTTVGGRKIVRVSITDTMVYTAYTTLYNVQNQTLPATTSTAATVSTSSSASNAPSSLASSTASSSASSSVFLPAASTANSSTPSATPSPSFSTVSPPASGTGSSTELVSSGNFIESDPIKTLGTLTMASSSSVSSMAVVTAIPFSCPEAADQRVDQVVGDFRLDYLVLCNTEIITQDRVGRPIPVESETSCAAQCSLLNAQSGQDTCQAASFQPYTDGRKGGTCTISGSETEYVGKPGSVAVVHTGTFSNGDECQNLNSTDGPRRSIDTSALISSITEASFSLSTPGLVTQSADGGVFETKFYANSTDANGVIHWSWYALSESSSYWWAVYSTEWSCTATISRTIVQQPAEPVTITEIMITTIINGATTTLISGTSTRVFTRGGGGVIPPTFVPASTTASNGEITTWFSLATQTSTGASTVTPLSSISALSIIEEITTVRIADNVTVSGGTSTFFSTGDAGLSLPSTTNSTTAGPATSTSSSTPNVTSSSQWIGETGGYGSLSSLLVYSSSSTNQTATAQTGVWTSAGSTFASASTGTAGVITPSTAPTASASSKQSIQAVSSSSVLLNSSLSILTLVDTLVWSTAGSTATTFRTWASGIVSPSPSVNSSFITLVSVTPSVRVITSVSSTSTSTITEESGIILPTSTTSIGPFTNETILTISSTQSNGNLSITKNVALTSTLSTPGLTSSLTIQSLSSLLSSSNLTVTSSTNVYSSSSANTSTFSTSEPSITPLSSNNVTTATSTGPDVFFTSTGGTAIFTILGSTAITFASSDNGIISPSPSSKSTLISPPSVTPTLSWNTTFAPPSVTNSNTTLPSSTGPPFTNSEQDRTRGLHSTSTSVRASLGSTGIPVPSINASMSTLTDLTSQSALTISSSLSNPPFSNSDRPRTGSFNESSSSVALTSSSIASPSLTPTSNLNTSSTSTGPGFSNSDRPRTGGFNESSSFASTPYSSITSATSSVTLPSATPTPSLNTSSTSTGPGFSNSDRPRTGRFNESTSSTSVVHTTGTPILSLNTSTASTDVPFSNTDAPRTPNFNSTSLETGGGVTMASVTPISSANASTTFASLASSEVSSNPRNSTSALWASTSEASSGLPSNSANSSSNVPTTTSSFTDTITANLTISTSALLSSETISSTTRSLNSTQNPPTDASSPSGSFPTSLSNSSSTISVVSSSDSTVPTSSGFTVASISNPPNSLNSSTTDARFISNMTSLPTATPSVTANLTTGFISSIPSASPSRSFNATTTQSLSRGNLTSRASATPTFSLNSTTPADTCPTAAIIRTVTSVQLATSIQVQTVTVVQTQIQIQTLDAVATPASSSPAPSSSVPSSLEARLRQPGSPAIQEQIDAACADTNNLVLNPDYVADSDGRVPGWSSDASDPVITVSSEQTPTGNSTMAEIKSAIVGRSLSLTQPLVLCPRQQYTLSALNRQVNALAKCTLTYTVGSDNVLSVTPQEGWLERSAFFTAKDGVQGASVDLKITASCAGYGGLPVADQDGWMRVEISGVSVVRDVGR